MSLTRTYFSQLSHSKTSSQVSTNSFWILLCAALENAWCYLYGMMDENGAQNHCMWGLPAYHPVYSWCVISFVPDCAWSALQNQTTCDQGPPRVWNLLWWLQELFVLNLQHWLDTVRDNLDVACVKLEKSFFFNYFYFLHLVESLSSAMVGIPWFNGSQDVLRKFKK